MNKKLGKKTYFFSLWIFRKQLDSIERKRQDVRLKRVQRGLQTPNGKIWSIFCAALEEKEKKKSPTWVNLAWPGLVWFTACRCSLGRQMRGRWQDGLLIGFSYPPTTPPPGSLLSFSSNMIVSSPVHTWQNKARFPLKCHGTQFDFVPFGFAFIFFSFKKNKDELILEMFLRKPAWKREPWPRGQFKELASGAPLLFRGPLLHRLHP